MIEAKELRIGNLIKTTYNENIYKVWEIRGSVLELDSKIGDNHIHSISLSSCLAIPITEEWLLKLGATKYEEGRFYLDISKTLMIFWNISDDYFICELSSRSYHVCYCNHTKYIHQLQNLYYSLTGEELEII